MRADVTRCSINLLLGVWGVFCFKVVSLLIEALGCESIFEPRMLEVTVCFFVRELRLPLGFFLVMGEGRVTWVYVNFLLSTRMFRMLLLSLICHLGVCYQC